jgi:hypothetical protein
VVHVEGCRRNGGRGGLGREQGKIPAKTYRSAKELSKELDVEDEKKIKIRIKKLLRLIRLSGFFFWFAF